MGFWSGSAASRIQQIRSLVALFFDCGRDLNFGLPRVCEDQRDETAALLVRSCFVWS